jgi:membrane-associated PAP2 superfamily phosphatase
MGELVNLPETGDYVVIVGTGLSQHNVVAELAHRVTGEKSEELYLSVNLAMLMLPGPWRTESRALALISVDMGASLIAALRMNAQRQGCLPALDAATDRTLMMWRDSLPPGELPARCSRCGTMLLFADLEDSGGVCAACMKAADA